MIRALVLLAFWGVSILIVGPPLLLYALLTGNINPLYYVATRLAISACGWSGVKIEIRGMENLQPGQQLHFHGEPHLEPRSAGAHSQHSGRCSVLVKKELFRIPILGTGMRMATWCRWIAAIARPPSRA